MSGSTVAISGFFARITDPVFVPTGADPEAVKTNVSDVGGISADGVSIQPSADSESVYYWQNNAKARTLKSNGIVTLTVPVLQHTREGEYLYWGAERDLATGKLIINAMNTVKGKFVFYTVDNSYDGVAGHRREELFYIPDGTVTEVDEQSYVSTALTGYGVTIEAAIAVDDSGEAYNAISWERYSEKGAGGTWVEVARDATTGEPTWGTPATPAP